MQELRRLNEWRIGSNEKKGVFSFRNPVSKLYKLMEKEKFDIYVGGCFLSEYKPIASDMERLVHDIADNYNVARKSVDYQINVFDNLKVYQLLKWERECQKLSDRETIEMINWHDIDKRNYLEELKNIGNQIAFYVSIHQEVPLFLVMRYNKLCEYSEIRHMVDLNFT